MGLLTGGTYSTATLATRAGFKALIKTVARNYLINKATEQALTPVMSRAMTYAAEAGVSPTYLQIGMLAFQTSGLVKAAGMRGGGTACFVAGTRVAVGSAQNGTFITRSIQDIKVGDLVLARDQYDAGDDLDLRRVSQVFVRQSNHLRALVIEGDEGNLETLQTTDEHPFYVQGRGWVGAGQLRQGDLVQEADGTWQTVLSSVREDHAAGITVYNFEIEGDHTYFVHDGVGEVDAVWVHNATYGHIIADKFSVPTLQHFFDKHKSDFGLSGKWSHSRLDEIRAVLASHIDAPTTKAIVGTNRGKKVTHHVDPLTGLNVVETAQGELMGAYKLDTEQLQSVLTTCRLF